MCGTGVQNDRGWKAQYDELKHTESQLDVDWDAAVHRSLLDDWRRLIIAPSLLADLSRLPVPVTFVLAENDIRPSWPVEQLVQLVPDAELEVISGAGHSLWHSHPDEWRRLIAAAVAGLSSPPAAG